MTAREAQILDIKNNPEKHKHDFNGLQRCCFVNGAMDLGLMDAHGEYASLGTHHTMSVVARARVVRGTDVTKLQPKRNIWAVRDDAGLVHTASVTRFEDNDKITALHVSTGCVPRVAQRRNENGEPWTRFHLPNVLIYAASESTIYQDVAVPRFTIVEWDVRATPTCFGCAMASPL